MSRTTSSTIVPAVPVVPVTPVKADAFVKIKKGKQPTRPSEVIDAVPLANTRVVPATPTKSLSKAPFGKTPTVAEPPTNTAEDAANKKESKEKTTAPEVLSKGASKTKAASKKAEKTEKPEKTVKEAEESSQAAHVKQAAEVSVATGTSNANTKRQHPSKLDIPMAKVVGKEPAPATVPQKAEPRVKNVRTLPPVTHSSVPPSPAAAAAPSPIKHTAAPRTLRLVSTPKPENSPAAAVPTPSLPQIPTVDKLRSRQASIASLNQPGTPASELISDTASMTSGMVSRASSPPPSSIVGSAPVRKITKAQAKKNRQERKRQEEESMATEDKSDVEVVQAPIIGRKKKTKKPSSTPKPVAAMASAMAAAAKSQPVSPRSATVEDEPLETPTVASVRAQSARNSASATPEPEPQPVDARDRRDPSAQSVLHDLQKSGDVLVSALEFFKPLSSTLTHGSRTTPSGPATSPLGLKIHFSQADLDALAKKKPVRLSGPEGRPDSRTLITPNGKFFWGLTHELEEKALSLESRIEQYTGQARFHPSSRTPTHYNLPYSPTSDVLPAIATALKEAGKKLTSNSPSDSKTDIDLAKNAQLPAAYAHEAYKLPGVNQNDVLPQSNHTSPPVQAQTPADAGAYLNQFVLPKTDNPPPNQPRPEMAAVGGAPGSGTSSISVPTSRFEKAARAVVEGGAVGSTEIDGLGSMFSDRLGGVFVQGLESLVGAGLGMGDGRAGGSIQDLLRGGLEQGSIGPELKGGIGLRGRGSVLSLEEAEAAMLSARREHEVLERKLAGLMKKNKKLVTGNAR